jgi:hypothetical protein
MWVLIIFSFANFMLWKLFIQDCFLERLRFNEIDIWKIIFQNIPFSNWPFVFSKRKCCLIKGSFETSLDVPTKGTGLALVSFSHYLMLKASFQIDIRFKIKFVKWVMICPIEILSNDKIIIMAQSGNVPPHRSPFSLLEVKFFLLQVKIHLQIKNPHMVHQIIKDFLLEVNLIFNNLVINNLHLLIVMNLFFK